MTPSAEPLSGDCFIAGTRVTGAGAAHRGVDPARGETLEPAYRDASLEQLRQACAAAAAVSQRFAATSADARATLLDTIAVRIEADGEHIVTRADRETALGRARLQGELARTTGQLRHFARLLRDGGWQDVRIVTGDAQRQPLPRPDLRSLRVPIGPVAVFGASNFPLAFSVAGGDTASALAAGCPVVVKMHPAHPGTSERVARCVALAIAEVGLPAGLFSMLAGVEHTVGTALVRDADIAAVGFTGSRVAGIALMKHAALRPVPIPVFAEMSSINPVLLFPAALRARAEQIADGLLGSLTLGAGQFCTCPGVVIAVDGEALERFVAALETRLPRQAAGTMLSAGIRRAYDTGVRSLASRPGITPIGDAPAAASEPSHHHDSPAHVFQTSAMRWLSDATLADEVFGATALLVRCASSAEFERVVASLEGQLTATLQIDEADHPFARALMPTLAARAGRIVCNGFPTGVEVSSAMVHGGPFPATSDGRSTSVGSMAIERFLRPLCFQDVPSALLPDPLR